MIILHSLITQRGGGKLEDERIENIESSHTRAFVLHEI